VGMDGRVENENVVVEALGQGTRGAGVLGVGTKVRGDD
jgi:hypothetical protein